MIKEKIKKIGKRNNCILTAIILIALLIALLFPSLGINKASALSAPSEKRLNLNGITYSYQTSLNELRNNYGVLNNVYENVLFQIMEDTEGENHLTCFSTTGLMTDNETESIKNTLNKNIKFYKNNKKLENEFVYDTLNATDYPPFTFGDVENNEFTLSEVTNFEINLENIIQNSYITSLTNDKIYTSNFIVNLLYFKKDYVYNDNTSIEEMYNNSILQGYGLSDAGDFYFEVENINNYYLKAIQVVYDNNRTTSNFNYGYIFNRDIISYNQTDSFEANAFQINNIKFIKNNEANIIKFDVEPLINVGEYKGNYLLSTTKADANLIEKLNNSDITTEIVQSFPSSIYFGGENGKRVENIYYMKDTFPAIPTPIYQGTFYCTDVPQSTVGDVLFYSKMGVLTPTYPENYIKYFNQNQLLYVPQAQSLAISSTEYKGSGLSAQIEDVLYGVQKLGNTEEIERNENIKKDFENMLYVTGAFTVVGLLLGFLFGNPIAGAIVGAVAGFGLTIIPLLIDGLQAIFGTNFLSGLQSFFRSIAGAIAGVVSAILNFLLNIITNPFVLVLILIIAILYLFVFRKK